jgi:hypothetical protein
VPGKAVVCEVIVIQLPFMKKEGSIEFTVNFGDSTSSISFHVSVMGGNISGCPRRLQRGGGARQLRQRQGEGPVAGRGTRGCRQRRRGRSQWVVVRVQRWIARHMKRQTNRS